MSDRKVGHNDHVDRVRRISKVSGDSLLNITVEFIERAALGEDVFPDATRAPVFSIEVGFEFYKHGS